MTPDETFDRSYVVDPNSGCWLWTESVNGDGYGMLSLGHRRARVRAHRFAYERFVAPIPAGNFVCHHCDVPACVNPAHLFTGTQLDNMRDAARKGRCRASALLHPESVPRGDEHWSRREPARVRRGRAHHGAKITEADVLEIRARADAGEAQRSIAAAFGLQQMQISRIVRRERWAHVGKAVS